MNATKYLTEGGTQERFEDQACSPSLVGGLQQQAIYLSASNLVLSLTAMLRDHNRIVHKDFPHFQSSSGSSTRLFSTAEPTKFT